MRRAWPLLFLLPAACVSPQIRNDPASSDFYGLDVGLVRVYRSRLPICGRPHDHYMEKVVEKELPFSGDRAVLVEGRLSTSVELHGIPPFFREVFAETDPGFGFYDVEGDAPEAGDPRRVELELPKPVVPGTRYLHEGGEIIVEAVEDVVVTAGKFVGCVRVRYQFTNDANVFWYAPGVGMVRGYSEKKGKDGRPAMEFELIKLSRR